MIRINLLPVRVSRKKEAGKQQLALFGLVVVAGLLGNFLWSHSRAADLAERRAKLARTKQDIAQLEKIIGEVKNIKEEQAKLKDKLAVLDRLKAARAGPVRMLDDLASITPKRLWLKKMDEKGGAVTFEGVAATIDDVSTFMKALKQSKYFGAVELKKTTAKAEKRYRLVEFVLNARVNYTPDLPVVTASAASPGAAPAPRPR